MPPLEDGGAEMHVVDVQRVAVDVDVGSLQASFLAGLPREVVLGVIADGEPAEDGVAELMATQMPRGRHHPAHAERRADLFDVADAAGPAPITSCSATTSASMCASTAAIR